MPKYYREYLIHPPRCKIVQAVIERILIRAAEGDVKYGCTLEEQTMSTYQALAEALEEFMDAAMYLEKAMSKIDYDDDLMLKIFALSEAAESAILDVTEIIQEMEDKYDCYPDSFHVE